MEVKQFVTFAVTIILGVVLISGLVVPAIGGLGSGGGGSGPSSDTTYTNTGNIQMKSMSSMGADETHTIWFVPDENGIEMRYDDTVYMSKTWNEMHNGTYWNIPIIIASFNTDMYGVVAYEFNPEEGPVLSSYTYKYNLGDNYSEWELFNTQTEYLESIPYEIDVTSAGFSMDGSESIPFTMALSTDGDWVLAETPVINPSKEFYLYGQTDFITQGNYVYQQMMYGKGDLSFFTSDYAINPCGMGRDTNADEFLRGYIIEDDYRIDITTTTVDAGIRLGNTTFSVEWWSDNGDTPEFTSQASFNTYIVPKTVSKTTTQNGWLTDDFSNVPNEGLSIYAMMGSNSQVGIFMEKTDSGIQATEPFYIHDFSTNPVLTIGIGEGWCVYMNTLSIYNKMQGDYLLMFVNGYRTPTYTFDIHSDGSAGYYNEAEGGSPAYTLSNTIGFISMDGNMKTYYNEDAPKSDSMFTWIVDIGTDDDGQWLLTAGAYGGFKDPTETGGGSITDGGTQPVEPVMHSHARSINPIRNAVVEYTVDSMDFKTSGNNVTGVDVVYKAGTETVEKSYSLTGQSAPVMGNDGPSGSMMICVVPSGTEYGGGSGGFDIPATLSVMLSVIPILMLAGIIVYAVVKFKGA